MPGLQQPVVSDFTFRIEGGVDAPGTARDVLRRIHRDIGQDLMQIVTLLASELVSNAVRHASAKEVELKAEVTPETVRIEVIDQGDGFVPRVMSADPTRPHGWGLYLVDELADRWGVSQGHVWFELDRA